MGGLGKALTREFRLNGWKVIATDVERKVMAEGIQDEMVTSIAMDVSSDESVSSVAGLLLKDQIQIDLIINNAGIDHYFPLSETPVSQFKKILEVNLFGCYRVNQNFLSLIKKPGGRIINVSSEAVKINVPFMNYPISKQALESYSRTIRQELRFLGIDVVLVRPGAINTPFLDYVKNIERPDPDSLLKVPFGKFLLTAHEEIGKTIEPDVVARWIVKIANTKKTRRIYKINNSLQLKLASRLPFWLIDWIIYRRLR
jgi:NAD(P)-dependent dehydrogenase (short-subunit alcohol dehydrogenase family)